MTIWTLVSFFAVVGAVITALMRFSKVTQNIFTSFLQNFCGVWFFVSGAVKAIDPTGTAFKMEQYFAEFESTASGTWLKPIAGIFPWLSSHSIGFAIFMIVLELVLGVMLVMGIRNRMTAWIFFVTLVFFTVLTGFTFLTGYVPRDANFFNFGTWGDFAKENMRVTDCGCFGDFLKLDPRVSFLKDIFLLFPGLFFLFRTRWMHSVGSRVLRGGALLLSIVVFGAYCVYYSFFAEPAIDFRPFREGVNIREQKAAEQKAEEEREITGWKMENLQTKAVQTIPNEQYMGNLASYPKETWKVIEQVKTEPAIPMSKISEFFLYAEDDEDVTDAMLSESAPTLWMLSYKVPGTRGTSQEVTVTDTISHVDTVLVAGGAPKIVRTIDSVVQRVNKVQDWVFNPLWQSLVTERMAPLMKSMSAKGVKVYTITTQLDPVEHADMKATLNMPGQYLYADDILLKTIMRSNPGLLVMHNGKVVAKYHFDHLPTEAELSRILGK